MNNWSQTSTLTILQICDPRMPGLKFHFRITNYAYSFAISCYSVQKKWYCKFCRIFDTLFNINAIVGALHFFLDVGGEDEPISNFLSPCPKNNAVEFVISTSISTPSGKYSCRRSVANSAEFAILYCLGQAQKKAESNNLGVMYYAHVNFLAPCPKKRCCEF